MFQEVFDELDGDGTAVGLDEMVKYCDDLLGGFIVGFGRGEGDDAEADWDLTFDEHDDFFKEADEVFLFGKIEGKDNVMDVLS